MAPLPISRAPSDGILQLRRVSNSIRSVSSALRPRDITPSSSLLDTVTSGPSPVSRSLDTVRGLSEPLKRAASLVRRQGILAIPTTYQGLNKGPAPGTVVGITLGSVGGFLLILWLIYTCFNLGGRGGAVVEEEVIRHHSRSPRRTRSHSQSEVRQVSRSRTPPRRESRRETIVVEETRRTSAPVERDDDIVEVIEEHSPPRRAKSKRTSGFRTVDPAEFGGGSAPLRNVRR